jgi:hypothetical protein
MLGRGPTYAFVGRAPLAFRAAGVVMAAIFLPLWLLMFTSRWWAARSPDEIRSYPVHFKGGAVYYYQPPIGWFLANGLWLFFAAFIIAGLIMWLNRDRVERIG